MRASPLAIVAVAAGATVGATARWSIGELLASDGFPWATLIANLLGCAAIGVVAMGLQRGSLAWYFTVTGCLGSFTTASTFAVETRQLLDDGRVVLALVYVVASVAGGLLLVSATRTRAEQRWSA